MLKKVLTILLLTLMLPAFAEEYSGHFLDELEALAKLQATDVLQQSIEEYYKNNPDIDQGKYPILLHDSAIIGEVNLLKYLTIHDTHGVDFAYEKGPTPLGYISGDNQLEAAEILLNANADPNDIGDTDGIYPLASAVTSGNMQMIRLLLNYGAQVHIGAYYQSPLGLTLEKNDIETLQLFDTYRFKLDSMDDELRIIVIEYLNSDFVEEEVLKILKDHGFDIYAKTEEKASFFDEYSKEIEHSDVRKLLQDVYETNLESSSEVTNVETSPVKDEQEQVTPSENDVEGAVVEKVLNIQETQTAEDTSIETTEVNNRLESQGDMVKNEASSSLSSTEAGDLGVEDTSVADGVEAVSSISTPTDSGRDLEN